MHGCINDSIKSESLYINTHIIVHKYGERERERRRDSERVRERDRVVEGDRERGSGRERLG